MATTTILSRRVQVPVWVLFVFVISCNLATLRTFIYYQQENHIGKHVSNLCQPQRQRHRHYLRQYIDGHPQQKGQAHNT